MGAVPVAVGTIRKAAGPVKLVCHIGMPGTAVTHLQDSLAANPDWLAAHGVVYGDTLSPGTDHDTLFLSCATTLPAMARVHGFDNMADLAALRDRVAQALAAQCDRVAGQAHTMVLCSDALTGRMHRPEEIAHLRTLLAPLFDEVAIVLYVQRQDDAVLSLYDEHMRRGASDVQFRQFVDLCLGSDSPAPYLFYRRKLSKWIKVWGADAIVMRRFSPVDFIDGDIVADFMGVVLNTWEPDMEGFRPVPQVDPHLSAPALELLRRLQPHIPERRDGAINPQRAQLAPYIAMLPRDPRPMMAAGTSAHIMRYFAPANDWLAETFAPDMEEAFFPDRPDHPDRSNLGRITTEEMAELFGGLLAGMEIGK